MFDLSTEDTGSFIYLTILLAFLASGFLLKGQIKASKVIQYLFWWFLIILAMITLYSFRYDFQNFKNRLIAEIFPSKSIRVSDNQISINISQDKHYYINLKINNKNVKLMIDTGASDIVLSKDDARKAGINLNKLTYNKIYQTANGKPLVLQLY